MKETRQRANAVQVAAARPEESAWVSANAGTGKTHVLTNRIVRLLMSGVRPRHCSSRMFWQCLCATNF
mgnify:CR=1 FL=1